MSVKIVERKKNPLFRREEVEALLEHIGKPTPPRQNILPSLEKSLNVKADLIIINKIFSVKGKGESKLKVFVYSKKDDIPKEKLELIEKRKEKKKAKAETQAEGPPAPSPKPEEGKETEIPEEGEVREEKAAEEAKEEPKAEERKEDKPAEEAKPEEKGEEKTEGEKEEK